MERRVKVPTTKLQDLPNDLLRLIALGVDTQERCAPAEPHQRYAVHCLEAPCNFGIPMNGKAALKHLRWLCHSALGFL